VTFNLETNPSTAQGYIIFDLLLCILILQCKDTSTYLFNCRQKIMQYNTAKLTVSELQMNEHLI